MAPFRQPWVLGSPQRQARLASGLVLFTYVATHLLDHALCNASYAAADRFLLVQKFVWQGVPGTAALYGALLAHLLLGLQALYARRHFRWSAAEAAQLVLGLTIPALLMNHLAVTRTALTLYGLNKGYVAELASLWVASPAMGMLQAAVLVAAWTHGCIGLFFLARTRRWFPAWRAVLLTAAVLLPVLALLGFAQGGREVARALASPGFRAANLGVGVVGTPAQAVQLARLRDVALLCYAGAILAVLAARGVRRLRELRRGLLTIRYPGGVKIRVTPGTSVLDASRIGGLAHASVCGGRGRCSTCRVRVAWSGAPLPVPAAHEAALLARLGASPQVRLACQLRPAGDLAVVPLVPPAFALQFVAGRVARVPEDERFVAAMFVDLRGSTGMAESRAPFDSVFLLGRFIAAVTTVVAASGGRTVQFLGDGVLVLFGLETGPAEACRQALGAIELLRQDRAGALRDVAGLFAQESAPRLGFGIGLHCGMAIVGEIALSDHVSFTALGETVNMAYMLQEFARDRGVLASVSDRVFELAGADGEGFEPTLAVLRGRRVGVRTLRVKEAVLF